MLHLLLERPHSNLQTQVLIVVVQNLVGLLLDCLIGLSLVSLHLSLERSVDILGLLQAIHLDSDRHLHLCLLLGVLRISGRHLLSHLLNLKCHFILGPLQLCLHRLLLLLVIFELLVHLVIFVYVVGFDSLDLIR